MAVEGRVRRPDRVSGLGTVLLPIAPPSVFPKGKIYVVPVCPSSPRALWVGQESPLKPHPDMSRVIRGIVMYFLWPARASGGFTPAMFSKSPFECTQRCRAGKSLRLCLQNLRARGPVGAGWLHPLSQKAPVDAEAHGLGKV